MKVKTQRTLSELTDIDGLLEKISVFGAGEFLVVLVAHTLHELSLPARLEGNNVANVALGKVGVENHCTETIRQR